uniref:Uncharacterized protein n=1 Tax=Pyxicephalus adspersus TaxID=30357 RepID=A0AAV3AYV5_PYXAD|nr:TPA: hypothetical protein GDO54_000386 [Pyxicephalus adspersus]
MVIAGDLSYIAANPKEQHLQKAIHKLRQSVQAVQKFRHEAETKLLNILKFPHPEGRRCLAQHNSDSHAATNKFSTPVAKFARAQMTPDRSNILIGSSGDMDPKISKKMKALDFLSRVPSPPLLTPVRPLVSPSLQRAFRPPRSMQKEEQTRQQPTLMSRGEFVADEELAMINTQVSGLEAEKLQPKPEMSADQQRIKISPYQSEGKANPSLGSHTNNITTTKKEDPSFTDQGALRKRRRHRL